MKYYDKNNNEIKAGDKIMLPDGSVEEIYATTDIDGNESLGIMATSKAFIERHPDCDIEYYALEDFPYKKSIIIK